ncbi:MAG: hypothetical protein NZ739_04965 [Verrucomicrobiae bacterium]|nr:hypothetical protein [Verrucomicrobiae bacterium]MCX7723128.1 hypothetical protein [Verrucomicrobiae bacterium]MDW7979297.1 hypothetical protein [Verrucomicrobiales bacterium]
MLVCGCRTTPKIDWESRIGTYTYDQAVLELGPPDRYAKLTDDTVVAEWVTRRGTTQVWVNYTYGHGYWWMHPSYVTTSSPERLLRLTFGPDGKLKDWKRLYR